MNNKLYVVLFSGGRTSAFLAKYIKENPKVADWWLEMENKYSSEEIPRFDLRTNKSIEELIELSKLPFTRAEDLHELSKKQCDLFDFETDCFCKAN